MKEGAENVQTKIQAKVESLKTTGENEKGRIFVICFFVRINYDGICFGT